MLSVVLDDQKRRVTLTLDGDIAGSELVRRKIAIAEHSATYDYVYDMRHYTGRLTHDDIDHLAKSWAQLVRGRDAGCASVLITSDAGFRLWARIFPVQFPGRRFFVVDTPEEAEAVLAAPA